MSLQSKMETEKQALIDSLSSMEKRLNEEKSNQNVSSFK